MDPDELSEPGGVVVPHGLCVAPSLEDGVGLDDLVLKGGLALLPLSRGADGGKVGNDLLGVLSLSGTRLASDENRPFVIAFLFYFFKATIKTYWFLTLRHIEW